MKECIEIFTDSLDKVLYSYVITTLHTSKKTIREVYKCDSQISLDHTIKTLKNSTKKYSCISISKKEPELIKKENYVTIYHSAEIII